MKRVVITISGVVQGVFFRAFVKNKASELGLTGYVKNIGDKVEVIVEGHELKIMKLIKYCKNGPVGSKVKDIVVKKENYENEFSQFNVR